MDKQKLVLKIIVLLWVGLVLGGCATAKGAGEGLGSTLSKTGQGMVEDSRNFWAALVKADKWLRENLW